MTMKQKSTAGVILAVDLGKYKSVACLYASGEDAEVRFVAFDTTPDELSGLLQQLRPRVLVIEACALAG